MFERKKLSTVIFVGGSILALLFFIILLIVWRSTFFYNGQRVFLDQTSTSSKPAEEIVDPYITKAPEARERIISPIINGNDPQLGPANAPITIVLFSDYQCTYCRQNEELIKKAQDKYPGKISLIWKDYPQEDGASASWQASVAGRCAAAQGKFWPYHDVLFNNTLLVPEGSSLSQSVLVNLASKEGLDTAQFKKCLADPQIENLIKANITEAEDLEIVGVPLMYINNQELMGEVTAEDLEKVITAELK